MKLVVGLGNPGPDYAETRHNVGFEIVLRLASRAGIALDRSRFHGRFGSDSAAQAEAKLALLLPETYMNRSGQCVAAAVQELLLDPADCLVVFDDLDLPFGRLRLRLGGGAGGHNGLGSVIDELGTPSVPRLRFGIGRPPLGIDPVAYVLAPFSDAERSHLDKHIGAAVDAVERSLRDGVREAMNQVNQIPEAAAVAAADSGTEDE